MGRAAGASAWILFREPDFGRFFTARFLSGSALQMQNVAVGWLVYDLTGSALALGLAGLAAFLPAIGLALVAGHVADRFDRRKVLTAAYAGNAAAACGLVLCALAGERSIWLIYALIVVAGSSRAFGNPASQALLPNLVARPLLGRAITLAATSWQSATVLGPAAGGLLYVFGPQVVFGTAAAFFTAASLCVATLRHRPAPSESRAMSWTSILAGIGFIRSRPVLLGAVSLDLFAVLLGGATALLPIYAQTILHTGPVGLGLLRSMPGAGAVMMSVFLATRPLERRTGRVLFAAIVAFGLATIGFGLSENIALSMAALFVAGAADTVNVVVRQTLVQAETPDEMRGRVAAVNTVFIGASNELGEFESGVLAAWLGAVPAVVIGGAGTIVVAALWIRLFPELWRRDRLIE
ncbi:MFS transporter [Enterovirga sp.]|uniref:MFS transporter n=1 Tax=Enterovirga sp. TaxID=2026350 RepID=UPI0026201C69|nr:MFS transporter [Enterovirga sp.]MDB5592017.1 major facilitator superfamily 1 [Enterovirga sp.]